MPRQPSLTDEAGATGSWSRGGEPGGADMVCSLIAREYLGLFYPKSPIWPAENTIRRRRSGRIGAVLYACKKNIN